MGTTLSTWIAKPIIAENLHCVFGVWTFLPCRFCERRYSGFCKKTKYLWLPCVVPGLPQMLWSDILMSCLKLNRGFVLPRQRHDPVTPAFVLGHNTHSFRNDNLNKSYWHWSQLLALVDYVVWLRYEKCRGYPLMMCLIVLRVTMYSFDSLPMGSVAEWTREPGSSSL